MSTNNTKTNGGGLKSLYLKEDWWAVWIGLATVAIGLILWQFGGSIKEITLSFKSFSSFLMCSSLLRISCRRVSSSFFVRST